jgi:hypothetical protein
MLIITLSLFISSLPFIALFSILRHTPPLMLHAFIDLSRFHIFRAITAISSFRHFFSFSITDY